jgi:subtilisin family serine protease
LQGCKPFSGNVNEISAFSRIGEGIWNSIKPDVVEYGGGLVISKNGLNQINNKQETSVELANSTMDGGPAMRKDSVGTSFSTPKVSHIAAILKKLYPEENVNMIRALIAQGARLPGDLFRTPTLEAVQYFGYGLPEIDRVTINTVHLLTF